MYSTATVIVIAFSAYIFGVLSTLFFDRKGLSLEQTVSLGVLCAWLAFTMLSYTQGRELSIFFNAAGMGAVGNLLGIKTTEMLSTLIKKK